MPHQKNIQNVHVYIEFSKTQGFNEEKQAGVQQPFQVFFLKVVGDALPSPGYLSKL